ncbi:MAG: PEP-CTERM sorting domain-containing protein, partial [Verrucomicrobiota bacterium]
GSFDTTGLSAFSGATNLNYISSVTPTPGVFSVSLKTGTGIATLDSYSLRGFDSSFDTSFASAVVSAGPSSGIFGGGFTINLAARFGSLFLPPGYVSGAPLPNGSSIFANQSFGSMGLVPGIYTPFATSRDSATLIVQAPTSPIPEPSTWIAIAGMGGLAGLLGIRYFRKRRMNVRAKLP